jgi:putative transposase
MIEQTVEDLTPLVGTRPACRALGASHATIYRRRRPPEPRPARPRAAPVRALSEHEREAVLAELHSERFVDCSPAQVWATLLDEGRYLASERTMYRLLAAEHGGVRERRDQREHPAYAKPELLAERPNELYSWDITKLLGPAKWTYYYLYVILDVFSRYAVGWTVQHRESAQVASDLIAQTVAQQQIAPAQLTVHADRGSSMTSKPVAFMLADLGVLKTHNRPYTSTDNPYSEAQFKTLKYRPGFPARFENIEQARAFCRTFFDWYRGRDGHCWPPPAQIPACASNALGS